MKTFLMLAELVLQMIWPHSRPASVVTTDARVRWQQGYVRGTKRVQHGPDAEAQAIGLHPYSSTDDFRDEAVFQGPLSPVAQADEPAADRRTKW